MIKIVLDTNALIDGSGDNYNYCNRIINEVIAGQLLAFANSKTLRENRLLIGQKILDPGYKKRLEYFFNKVKLVGSLELSEITEDRQDNKILGSAVAAGADFLITSDRHLLNLGKFNGINIITPAEFWNKYEDGAGGGWKRWLNDFIR